MIVMEKIKDRINARIIAFFVVVIIYLAVFSAMDSYGFWVVDDGLKFIQAKGIILNKFMDYSIPWPGVRVDPNSNSIRYPRLSDSSSAADFMELFP
jgi:hypothetical protein